MLRVLVVEDDAAIRELLGVALHEAGHETILALDGQHALRLALVSHPDVVVLDLGLPIMSGPEFVANWRAHSADTSAPIVVISGCPDVMAQAQRLGACAAFAKPFDVEALVAAVGQN
jgi:two-component system, OmpR family, KDP operon response regulator KdpE